MALWSEKIDKKKLGAWGSKTDEEILEALNKHDEFKTENEKLKTTVSEKDTAVSNLNNQFQEVKRKLDEAEANGRKQQTPPKKEDEEKPDFLTDPDAAFNSRMQPFATAVMQQAATTARMQAQQQLTRNSKDGIDGRLFEHWGGEIDTVAKNTPLNILGNPMTWVGIFLQVKGFHSDELADPTSRKEKYAFLESGSSNAQRPDAAKKDDEATEQEKKVAERMGIPLADFMKNKKKMTFVGA